jgi:hypothetical protein
MLEYTSPYGRKSTPLGGLSWRSRLSALLLVIDFPLGIYQHTVNVTLVAKLAIVL